MEIFRISTVTKTKHKALNLWNVPQQLKKCRSLKIIYCYWLRTSNSRRYIMTVRWDCMMTSKRIKPVARCLFQPINRDVFAKWKKMDTRICYETTSLKHIKNWMGRSYETSVLQLKNSKRIINSRSSQGNARNWGRYYS